MVCCDSSNSSRSHRSPKGPHPNFSPRNSLNLKYKHNTHRALGVSCAPKILKLHFRNRGHLRRPAPETRHLRPQQVIIFNHCKYSIL